MIEYSKKKKLQRGLFISFEGGDGSGKTTQIHMLAEFLQHNGYEIVLTREPGGTTGAEALRYILLNAHSFSPSPLLEALLFAAGREDHITQLIAPALAAGKIVLCDRFIDSTRVYQGLAGRVSEQELTLLEEISVADCIPDITFFLDVDSQTGMQRAAQRRSKCEPADRFEKESLSIHEDRRQAFLEIAQNEPNRCFVINTNRSKQAIGVDIATHVLDKLKEID